MARIARAVVLVSAALVVVTGPAAAGGVAPIDAPAGFAEVRARFEVMTRAQLEAAGYVVEPVCISSPAGGMGFHAINMTLFNAQFASGNVDPANPPLVLLDAQNEVIGLEWEAAEATGGFTIYGQTAPLLPGHPGVPEPHYMLHAFFRPNGQVLFDVFDPEVTCPPVPNTAVTGTDQPAMVVWLMALGGVLIGSVAIVAGSMARRRH